MHIIIILGWIVVDKSQRNLTINWLWLIAGDFPDRDLLSYLSRKRVARVQRSANMTASRKCIRNRMDSPKTPSEA